MPMNILGGSAKQIEAQVRMELEAMRIAAERVAERIRSGPSRGLAAVKVASEVVRLDRMVGSQRKRDDTFKGAYALRAALLTAWGK
jgi:hypothetical protein